MCSTMDIVQQHYQVLHRPRRRVQNKPRVLVQCRMVLIANISESANRKAVLQSMFGNRKVQKSGFFPEATGDRPIQVPCSKSDFASNTVCVLMYIIYI